MTGKSISRPCIPRTLCRPRAGSLLLLCLVLLASMSPALADSRPELFALSATSQQYDLTPTLEYLEDPTGLATLDEIRSRWSEAERARTGGNLNFGFTDSAYWFRVQLVNRDSPKHEWVLEMLYPIMDQVEVFYRYADGREHYQIAGDSITFSQRSRQNHHINFALELARGERVNVFLRARTSGAVQMPLTLWSEDAFTAQDHNKQIVFGIYYGLILALVGYNLLIFLIVRDINYFWYVAYILSYALMQASLNGLSFEYLWPDAPLWNNRAMGFFLSSTMFLVLAFSRSFLALKTTAPRLNRVFKILMAGMALIWSASLFAPYDLVIRAATLASSVGVVMVIVAGAYCWTQDFKPARYFMIAWTALLIGMLFYILKTFGMLPANFFTEYAIQIGSVFEVLLLSLALADRIRVLTSENHRIQHELNSKLESRVNERTEELKTANRMLEILSATDGLTGIHNRRHFDEAMARECKRASRAGPLSVLLLDVDHFKRFNDTYGHQAGDECLTRVARILTESVQREADVVARYGGEEFVVILPSTPGGAALALAETIRERIRNTRMQVAEVSAAVTVSIGVTTTQSGQACDPTQLIECADRALYAAKENGRDRCVLQPCDPESDAPCGNAVICT